MMYTASEKLAIIRLVEEPELSVQKVLQNAELKLSDIDLIELNEAFAAQVLACTKGLETMCIGGGQGLAAVFERV